jgi:hypothetical protein
MKDDRKVRSLGIFADVEVQAKKIISYYKAKDLLK